MMMNVRELGTGEFPRAGKEWERYRGQKANTPNENIFGTFVDGRRAYSDGTMYTARRQAGDGLCPCSG
jgi:hypothetical protein